MVGWGVSTDTLMIHTFLSAPACTDMVFSKELERKVTTNTMAKEPSRLKTLASFLYSTRSVRFFYGSIFLRPKDEKGLLCTCHV